MHGRGRDPAGEILWARPGSGVGPFCPCCFSPISVVWLPLPIRAGRPGGEASTGLPELPILGLNEPLHADWHLRHVHRGCGVLRLGEGSREPSTVDRHLPAERWTESTIYQADSVYFWVRCSGQPGPRSLSGLPRPGSLCCKDSLPLTDLISNILLKGKGGFR